MDRLKKFSSLCLILVIALVCLHICVAPVAATEEEGWIKNSANGHYYKLTNPMNWLQAETQAMEWGGYLATINDANENEWIVSTFGASETIWIGYTDKDVEGDWNWISGEDSTYTNWFHHACGALEPTDSWPGEDAAAINFINSYCICCSDVCCNPAGCIEGCTEEPCQEDGPEYTPGKWNDLPISGTLRGIVEISSPFAAFEATPTSGSTPLKVTFTDKSTGDGITSRVWQYKLNSDSTWTTFILDKKSSYKFINDGIYDIKLTVTGSGGSDDELKSELLKIGCDFSTQPEIEKCFGGIGIQCEGINKLGLPVVSFKKIEKTCEVNGWMSIGSILHDKCCLRSGNTGVMCANPDGSDTCQKEWDEAFWNTACSKHGSTRQWKVTFGPYPVGYDRDETTNDLRAPSGTRVNPEYQYLCQLGTCRVDKKGNTQLKFDDCGFYCVCQ